MSRQPTWNGHPITPGRWVAVERDGRYYTVALDSEGNETVLPNTEGDALMFAFLGGHDGDADE